MYYNLKSITYKGSTQYTLYNVPVHVGSKLPDSSNDSSSSNTLDAGAKNPDHSLQVSVSRTINSIYSICRSNTWEYFITLTFDPKLIDSTDFDLCVKKLNIWTNNLKKRYAPDLKYCFVPELHLDGRKWHFHGLFANVGNIPFQFSGKVCVGKYIYDYFRKPYATKVYNLPLWRFGWSTGTIVRHSGRASSYITKYITKDLAANLKNKRRFYSSQNLDVPKKRVYNVVYDNFQSFLFDHVDCIDHMSNVCPTNTNLEMKYIEVNHG